MSRHDDDMKILLLSRNHVVRDMVKLAADKSGVRVETIEKPEDLKEDRCDLLLVDEYFADRDWIKDASRTLLSRVSVLLAAYADDNSSYFDRFVQKPFLPDEIGEIIESLKLSKKEAQKEKIDEEYDLDSFVEEESLTPSGPVLDPNDIEQIRKLLDDKVADLSDADLMDSERQDLSGEVEAERVLRMLAKMNPKKLRKLLRGARIDISIHFPEDE